MPPDWEGRNRTLNHLIQSQVALPVCVLPNEMAAEVGFEPTKLLFQRQVTLPIRLLGINGCPSRTRTYNHAVNSRPLHH